MQSGHESFDHGTSDQLHVLDLDQNSRIDEPVLVRRCDWYPFPASAT